MCVWGGGLPDGTTSGVSGTWDRTWCGVPVFAGPASNSAEDEKYKRVEIIQLMVLNTSTRL